MLLEDLEVLVRLLTRPLRPLIPKILAQIIKIVVKIVLEALLFVETGQSEGGIPPLYQHLLALLLLLPRTPQPEILREFSKQVVFELLHGSKEGLRPLQPPLRHPLAIPFLDLPLPLLFELPLFFFGQYVAGF